MESADNISILFLIVVIAIAFGVVVVTLRRFKRHAASTDARLCRACGLTHPSFAQFCRRCGAKL